MKIWFSLCNQLTFVYFCRIFWENFPKFSGRWFDFSIRLTLPVFEVLKIDDNNNTTFSDKNNYKKVSIKRNKKIVYLKNKMKMNIKAFTNCKHKWDWSISP